MTHWTRRQFGLWSAAAMVVPGTALAGRGKKGNPLDELVLTAEWEGADEYKVTYALTATSPAAISIHYHLGNAELEGMKATPGLAYLNNNHPFSRRVMAPAMVDLPANKALLIGRLHLNLQEDERTAEVLFAAEIVLNQPSRKKTRSIALPPLPVVKPTNAT